MQEKVINSYFYLSIIFFIISIATSRYRTKSPYTSFLNSFAIFLYLALTILYFSATYFTDTGINEAVLFTVQYGLDGAGFGEYLLLIAVSTFLFVFIFALSYLYFRLIKNTVYPKSKRIKGAIHNTFLLFAFLAHPFILDLYSIYESRYTKQSIDFDHYHKKSDISAQKAKNLNLVYIYAESLEKTYFDESIFPNLLNNLKELKSKSTEFTDINQVVGSGWTIAGMVSSQCSIPLFMESGGNSMVGSDTFLSGAECLGDVLKNLDYYLVYMQGASTAFSGKNKYYSTHSFDEMYGREELTGRLKDKSYLNGWGLYDDSLLGLTYEKFEKLSSNGKKFGLFLLTLDTHHPSGQTSKSCSDIPYGNGENSILNAVHCSDHLVSQFIRKIQNSKYANNTLIILTSDHLAMKNTATNLLTKGSRKNLFLVFDPRDKQYTPISKPGSILDVAPTILHKLGIETDLGFGRNLFKKESLFSEFKDFNKKLLSWRDNILDFWEYPTLSKYYDVDPANMKVQIADHSYQLPVLFKIGEDHTLSPIFEFYSTRKLSAYLQDFGSTRKFIWIDSCSKISFLSDEMLQGNLCSAQGTLSEDIEVHILDQNSTISTDNLLPDAKVNIERYHARQNSLYGLTKRESMRGQVVMQEKEQSTSLEDGIIFNQPEYPKFIDKVSGMSDKEKWGRCSDANHTETVKFVFKEKLPKNLILELEAGVCESNTSKPIKIKIGNTVKTFTIKRKHTDRYQIVFNNISSNSIEFMPPSSTSADITKRKPGIAFVSMKIKSIDVIKKRALDTERLIAQAGGAIDKHSDTDSLEALNANYKKGFRLFELDILKTSDNIFVAAKNWQTWKKNAGYKGELPPTRDIFKSYKINNEFSPMEMDDINRWFQEYSDATLVTDMVNTPKEFADLFVDKSRLMMELASWEAVREAKEVGVMGVPTGGILQQIDGDKIAFLKKLDIDRVVVSNRMVNDQLSLIKKLRDAGIKVYVFYQHNNGSFDKNRIICDEFDTFYGIYTNYWDFNSTVNCLVR